MLTLSSALLLGLLLGMRHALEPDHLAAVSTLVVRDRSPASGALVGAFWGFGHAAALFCAGFSLVALQAGMPARLGETFELAVALMLVVLGARSIGQAIESGASGPARRHHHGHLLHVHPAQEDHVHVGRMALARRPLFVGLVHGLAGSGALTALAIARMPTLSTRLLFIGLFGLGSVLGMAFLTGLAGLPLSRFGRNSLARRGLSAATGMFSLIFGVCWAWPIVQGFLAP